MKKTILSLLIFVVATVNGCCVPQILDLAYSDSVNLFDKYEISFNLTLSYINPYDPDIVDVSAEFTSPTGNSFSVCGFYYEGYAFHKAQGYEHATRNQDDDCWMIRFTPTETGCWNFRIVVSDNTGTASFPSHTRSYHFFCAGVDNAHGFISAANTRYLKRDVVEDGVRHYHSFFPVGPNIAWYEDKNYQFGKPFGIYDYESYIDSLSGNGNYMRVWMNRYQYLSLYGPEYTQNENGMPKVYFDSSINQKDAAEFDHIVNYAKQHDISILACIFTFGDFNYINPSNPADPSIWSNNPYNTILGLDCSCDFFTDDNAISITKNLIRYIVSRWGYATNIFGWEFWNEVDNIFKSCEGYKHIEQDIVYWHELMNKYIRRIDAHNHMISTSMASVERNRQLYVSLFDSLDFVIRHDYENIQKAASNRQLSKVLYDITKLSYTDYPDKPFLIGEFGFGQSSGMPKYIDKDPYGIDFHNSIWSSMFSTSMGPGSFWWWNYLRAQDLFRLFKPIYEFSKNIPILSDSFKPYQTGTVVGGKFLVFPNNIETYYMMNCSEDTIYGWVQDTAFCYQSLRRLTDSVRPCTDSTGLALHFVDDAVFDPNGYVYTLNPAVKPLPSSSSNEIKIPVSCPVGTTYKVQWFNTETGLGIPLPETRISVMQDSDGTRYIPLTFPSCIRDIPNNAINNVLGDAVFAIYKL